MKLIIFSFIALLTFGCSKMHDGDEVLKLGIRKVDFDLTSIVALDCVSLDDYFADRIESSTVVTEKDLTEFSSLLDKLKPDVRAKVLIYRVERVDTLCLSNLGILYNGESMHLSTAILEFVKGH